MKPTVYYLTKFPKGYRDKTWWTVGSKKRALAFLRHTWVWYRVKGELVKVKACK